MYTITYGKHPDKGEYFYRSPSDWVDGFGIPLLAMQEYEIGIYISGHGIFDLTSYFNPKQLFKTFHVEERIGGFIFWSHIRKKSLTNYFRHENF